jgi:hypothetical protein
MNIKTMSQLRKSWAVEKSVHKAHERALSLRNHAAWKKFEDLKARASALLVQALIFARAKDFGLHDAMMREWVILSAEVRARDPAWAALQSSSAEFESNKHRPYEMQERGGRPVMS